MAWQDNAKKISSPEEKFEDTAIKSWKSRAKPVEEPRFENVSPQDSPLFSPREKWESERQNMPVDGRKGEEVVQLPTPTPDLFKGMSLEDALAVHNAYERHPRTKKSWTGELEYNGQRVPNVENKEGYDSPVEGLVDVAGGVWNAGKETLTNSAALGGLATDEEAPGWLRGLGVASAITNPISAGAAGLDIITGGDTAETLNENIPEYRSERGPMGDFLVSAGEWLPGGLAGARLAEKGLQSVKGPIKKYVGKFLGSEAGGAMTMDADTVNTLIGMDLPGLRGFGTNPDGSFDENRVRQKLNQINDAIVVGAALGGAFKAGGKITGYVGNVLYKVTPDAWQSMDTHKRKFVLDIFEMAGRLNDNMSKSEQNDIMSEISEYVAKNKKIYASFGDTDIKDAEYTQDTLSVIIKKLEGDQSNASLVQQLKEARSSALEGGSPDMEVKLNQLPRKTLEESYDQAKKAKGGDEAVQQTTEMIQKDADDYVEGVKDEVYRKEDQLTKADKDTNEILRQDESLGPKIREAEEKGLPFDADAERIRQADEIASEAQRAREEVLRPQTNEAYAKIPADSKILDPEGVTEEFERVKSSLPNELQDRFEELIEDGNYKNLAVDFAQAVKKAANNSADNTTKSNLNNFARYLERSGDEESVSALEAANKFFKETEGKFNQGTSRKLRDIPKGTDKWANTEILEQNRKTILGDIQDPTVKEQIQLLRDQLKLVESDPKMDDIILGSAASKLQKMVDEKGISGLTANDLRSSFKNMAGNLSEGAQGRMEKLIQNFEKNKGNVKELTKQLDAIKKESDRVEVEIYGDKLREFFEKDLSQAGKFRSVPNGQEAFEKMFSDPQAGERIKTLAKTLEKDPSMKKGAQVAVIKMIQKNLDKGKYPENFEKFVSDSNLLPKEALESWKFLNNEVRKAEAANVTRKGAGFNQLQFQNDFIRHANQLRTWMFGVLNPTSARIGTITNDLAKRYDPKKKVSRALDEILSDPDEFVRVAEQVISKHKGKMDPETRALIFRGIMNARKDHPDDSGNKSGAKKAMDQTEEILKEKVNPFK